MSSLSAGIAALVHKVWSRWMTYLFTKGQFNDDGSFTIDAESVERWRRQMDTCYDDLTADEQLSDIDIAHEYIAVFDDWTS
jgi:hypothetical protein